MNLRGLEVLLATFGGVLLILGITSGLTVAALGWALIGVAAATLGEAALVRYLLPHYGVTRRWARVAARLPGIRLLGDGGRSPPRLRGTMARCAVRIDQVGASWQTSVCPVHRDDRADVQVSLRWVDHRRGQWRTGDPKFDRLVEVQGVLPEGLLVLDQDTRHRVIQALTDGIRIDVDQVQWSDAAVLTTPDAAHRFERTLEQMVVLAGRLYALSPEKLRARARATILKDPHAEARARALWLYQDHYALDASDEAMIADALADDDTGVRLAASGARLATGDIAPEAEAVLAEAVARGEQPSWALEAAVARLLEHGRPEVVTPAMQARLRDEGPLPADVLTWALDQARSPAPRTIGHRLLSAPPADAAAAVAILLAAGHGWEPALIRLLDHPDHAVVDRTIEGLAFGGTYHAVPALRALSRNHRRPRRLRYAADDAVAAVRARGPRGPVGQLSLIDPTSPSGRVSVAD